MLRYMLDTDTVSHVLRTKDVRLLGKFTRHAEQICVSSITLGELRYGAAISARQAEIDALIDSFIARLSVLPFEARACSHYGAIRACLRRAGRPIGPLDLLIAAHARSEGLVLVTGNQRHFSLVPGLAIESWLPRRKS